MGRNRNGMSKEEVILVIQTMLLSEEFVWPDITKTERTYFVCTAFEFHDITKVSEPYKCSWQLKTYPRNGVLIHNHIDMDDDVPSPQDFAVAEEYPYAIHCFVSPDFSITHYWVRNDVPDCVTYYPNGTLRKKLETNT